MMIGDARRVLDLGCSLPGLDRLLVDGGATVIGIARAGDEGARAAACSRTIVADLDFDALANLLAGETFDAVFAGDILQHLHDPWGTLDAARALLNPGGTAIVTLRNSEHGAITLRERAGGLEYGAYGILDGGQLRFFTRDTIEQLFVRAGYRLERIETTTVELFAPSPALPAVAPAEFDAATIAAVRRNRDAETFEFIALATPLDDAAKQASVHKHYAAAASKLASAQASIDALTEELAAVRNGSTSDLAALEATVRALEALRGRAADHTNGLETALDDTKTELAESEREHLRARLAYMALAERFDALTAERQQIDTHCLRLTGAAATAQARALTAERALHRYVAPLADGVGSLESAIERRDHLTQLGLRSATLMAQLEALDRNRSAENATAEPPTLSRLARDAGASVRRLWKN
jgi:SAM-dependent methyltransferase